MGYEGGVLEVWIDKAKKVLEKDNSPPNFSTFIRLLRDTEPEYAAQQLLQLQEFSIAERNRLDDLAEENLAKLQEGFKEYIDKPVNLPPAAQAQNERRLHIIELFRQAAEYLRQERDVDWGELESAISEINDVNDNAIIETTGSILHVIQVRLSTSYGSDISNFTINGSGKNSISAGPNDEYGGASISGTIIDDNIGFGWVIEKLEESVNSEDPFETAFEKSHGIGFLINDTLYSTEFISSEVEVTSDDLIVNFIIKNAEKIAKEQINLKGDNND